MHRVLLVVLVGGILIVPWYAWVMALAAPIDRKATLAKIVDCSVPPSGYTPITQDELERILRLGRRIPGPIDLRYRSFIGLTLTGADLAKADLTGANLIAVDLGAANLSEAILDCAKLLNAGLEGTRLLGASLRRADLSIARLARANLFKADLTGADLFDSELEGADLRKTNLVHAIFQPKTVPLARDLAGAEGLDRLSLNASAPNPWGLRLLRSDLAEAGCRSLERQATFPLERWHDEALHESCEPDSLCLRNTLLLALRVTALRATTAYGLAPWRSLLILVGLALVFSSVYLFLILPQPPGAPCAIARLHRAGSILRVDTSHAGTSLDATPWSNREAALCREGLAAATGWALYYSLLCSVAFGFRDLNLSQWIERIQMSPFVLIAMGWARAVSGVQCVLSLFLLVLWILTYFGRPFD